MGGGIGTRFSPLGLRGFTAPPGCMGSPEASPVGMMVESVSPAWDSRFCMCADQERGGAQLEHPKATAAVTDGRAQGPGPSPLRSSPSDARIGPRAPLAPCPVVGPGREEILERLHPPFCYRGSNDTPSPPGSRGLGRSDVTGWGDSHLDLGEAHNGQDGFGAAHHTSGQRKAFECTV